MQISVAPEMLTGLNFGILNFVMLTIGTFNALSHWIEKEGLSEQMV